MSRQSPKDVDVSLRSEVTGESESTDSTNPDDFEERSLAPEDVEVICSDCDNTVRSGLDVFGTRVHVICSICNANSHIILDDDKEVIEGADGDLTIQPIED